MNQNKRRNGSPILAPPAAKKPRKPCSYGENCYRRNPLHLREFIHTHLDSILDSYSGVGAYLIPEHLTMQRQTIEEQLQIMIENNIRTSEPTGTSVAVSQSNDNKNKNNDTEITSSGILSQSSRENKSADRSDGCVSSVASKTNVAVNLVQSNTSTSTGSTTGNSDYRPIVKPTRRIEDFINVVPPKGKMAEKHRKASPYYIFYTTITAAKETHSQSNSITFQEILDPSLGELKCSLQINFMIDISWLLAQYYFAGYSRKRLTILYGEDMPDLKTISQKQKHVEAHMVNMGTPFGKHHTKMMLLCYEDGSMRVVVSTANLYLDDWENRTQGLWLSPSCPEMPESAMPHEGDSETGFKKSLIGYLSHYAMPCLTPYVERVRRCDFSYVTVFLVASVPGGHTDSNWGMCRVGSLLRQHCRLPKEDRHKWELIAQSSSIGSYGKEPRLWLTGDFQSNFCRVQSEAGMIPSAPPRLRLIYPSLENVRQSHDGLLGGGCLPYAASSHVKQHWLKEFLHQWKARRSHRDRAMPHIKSYMRISPDCKRAAYYLLTSANVSKAAWGTITKGKGDLRLMSYEAGVLFLPRFVLNREFFPLEATEDDCLPLVYDVPSTPYEESMSPWVMDYLHD